MTGYVPHVDVSASAQVGPFPAVCLRAAALSVRESAALTCHCLAQLSDEQAWWRPAPGLNSVGNLALHLCGNLSQWVLSGVAGEPDHRVRQAEFDAEGGLSAAQLADRLHTVAQRCAAVVEGADPADLLRPRRVQGDLITGVQALWHTIPHLRGHAQETVLITRWQLGASYRPYLTLRPDQL